jgi:6-phosphofructokinase 1
MGCEESGRRLVLRIGILTSGGDAPGMNAAARAVARTAFFSGVRRSWGYEPGTGYILQIRR